MEQETLRMLRDLAERISVLEAENKSLKEQLHVTDLLAKSGSPVVSDEERKSAVDELTKIREIEQINEQNRAAFK